jgi:hypothetical protein
VFNKNDGFQIIRRASTTSFKPRKYGKQRDTIALTQQSFPFKVYNKVVGGPEIKIPDSSPSPQFTTVFVPIFYDSKTITVETKTVLAEGANPLNPNFGSGNVAFGQGDARIYLSDFDSYVKFTLKQIDPVSGTLNPVNLSASKIFISFKDSAGNIFKFPVQDSTQENSLSEGEIVFKIPGSVRKRADVDSGVKSFYIVAVSEQAETLLYTGSVDIVENIEKETARVESIKTKAAESANSVPSAVNQANSEVQMPIPASPLPSQSPSLTDQLTIVNSLQVKEEIEKEEVQPIDIPGFSVDSNAASVKIGIKPVGVAPETLIKKNLVKSQAETKARQQNRLRK